MVKPKGKVLPKAVAEPVAEMAAEIKIITETQESAATTSSAGEEKGRPKTGTKAGGDMLRKPTCTACLVVQNEKPYLLEWIAYYRKLGFDRIVVYDNKSTDGSDILLKALAESGKIDYRLWPLGRMESPQVTAYSDAIRSLDTDWVLLVDVDEFLVLHQDSSVTDFLARFAERADVGAIGVNWRIFGDSHHAKFSNVPVIERFTLASEADFVVNRHFKTFTRVPGLRSVVNRHFCDAPGELVHACGKPMVRAGYGYSDETDLSVAQMNHYYCKTYDEYRKKMARGKSGVGQVDAILKYSYSDLTFTEHNTNHVADTSALTMLENVVREMDDLRAIVA